MDEDLHELIHLLGNIKDDFNKKFDRACELVDKLNNRDASRELMEKTIKKMLEDSNGHKK